MTGERSSKPRDLFIRVDAEVFESTETLGPRHALRRRPFGLRRCQRVRVDERGDALRHLHVEVSPARPASAAQHQHRALQVQWRVQVEQLGLNLLPPTAFSGVLPLKQHRFAVHFRGEQLGVEQERVVDPAALAKARDSQEGHLCHNRMRASVGSAGARGRTARPRRTSTSRVCISVLGRKQTRAAPSTRTPARAKITNEMSSRPPLPPRSLATRYCLASLSTASSS